MASSGILARLTKNGTKPVRVQVPSDEHEIQAVIVSWADQAAAIPPAVSRGGLGKLALLYAIPNGGRRDAITGARLKSEGVRAGMPDLHLPVARGPALSLYLEIKTPAGRLSDPQRRLLPRLASEGHLVAVCRSSRAAIDLLLGYLELQPTHDWIAIDRICLSAGAERITPEGGNA